MRFIHTSDWHLGKHLEGHSRLPEQEMFLEDFVNTVEENNIDMVIIAGDIYDTSNPPAQAEKLFYKTIKRLANNGQRPIIIIAGNHDNPERLSAASPLAHEHGIMIMGNPKSKVETGVYEGFSILESGEGYLEIDINKEKAVILTLPYPSEKRLNEVLSESTDDASRQVGYSEKIGQIFEELSSKFRDDTINLAVSHLFVLGGEGSDSERPIELGGSLIVNKEHLPQNAQYIALGHLHKPQKISDKLNVYYSGSPLQYSKSEINYSKCSYLVDIHPKEKANVEEVYFKNYKPIEVFKCNSIDEAMEKCEENKNRDMWAYLEIKTDEVIPQSTIKKMKELLPDIIEIKPIIAGIDDYEEAIDIKEISMAELFKEFYKNTRELEPKGELMDLFLDITNEEGSEYDEAH
jgi:exonuclease SbcD